VRLDHPARGAAQLFAIVLPRAESVDYVEEAPREQLTRDELARRYAGALVVNVGVEVR
jgi:hypothetical protein